MGHDQEDDPGSSCFIKQEPADEGIYASSRERTFSEIFGWYNKTDAQGLTLQPMRQSLDPQPTHVVWSPSVLSSSGPQFDASGAPLTSVSILLFKTAAAKAKLSQEPEFFDPFRSVSPPPSQIVLDPSVQPEEPTLREPSVSIPSIAQIRAKALHQPKPSGTIQPSGAIQPEEQRVSRTPSVSAPQPCTMNRARTLRQPQQSDCSQTPGRSETPPTPTDSEDYFPSASTVGAPTVWNPNTPIQSIECQSQTHDPPPTTLPKSREWRPLVGLDLDSDVTFQEQLRRYLAVRGQILGESASVTKGGLVVQGGSGESVTKGESHEKLQQHNRSQSANSSSPPFPLDPPSLRKFSTFMKLRNSLPIAALIAMMAPPNQTQVLTSLAELSGMQVAPGAPQPANQELPATMRSMLDNLMQKLNTDKAFLRSVVTYASGQVLKNGKHLSHNECSFTYRNNLDRAIDPKHILKAGLETGLDELTTLRQAREQLLKERIQFHDVLANHGNLVDRFKKQNGELVRELNQKNELVLKISELDRKTSDLERKNTDLERKLSAVNAKVEPEHNPFWVCSNMLDGSGTMCNGINQEWYLSNTHGQTQGNTSSRWTLRHVCVKCRQPNQSNRRYLTKNEAQMFTTFLSQQQTSAAISQQAYPIFQQHIAQPLPMFSQPMAKGLPMFSQPTGTIAMSPTAQQPRVRTMPNASTPPVIHHPVVGPTRTNPPIFKSNLTLPQIDPLPPYKSPYTPETPKQKATKTPKNSPSPKRKATEPPTDSPSPKRHPGFDVSPAVQDALRRVIPQKEWMKPKQAAPVGPGTSSEPISIDEEATAGDSGVTEQPGGVEDDMASLFGDDENENEMDDADFEADLCKALDEELRKEGRL